MWDPSSLTRGQTRVLCIGRQIPNHWTHQGSLWTKWFLSVYDPVITNGGTICRSILIYRDQQITSNLNERHLEYNSYEYWYLFSSKYLLFQFLSQWISPKPKGAQTRNLEAILASNLSPSYPLNQQKSFKSTLQCFSSVVQSCLTLWDPHGLKHARPPCSSPTPKVYSNSCPLSQQCHPTISSSVVPFSSFSLSQDQGLFKWVSSSHQGAKVLEFQL